MKNITVGEFCKKFNACSEARKWAYKLTPLKSKEKMSEIWHMLPDKPDWLFWTLKQIGVMDDRELRLLACQFVRETPLSNGRVVWDLLTDERSKSAVVVAEKFANGEASQEELDAAWTTAWAAWTTAWAARADARDAAWAASHEAKTGNCGNHKNTAMPCQVS